METNYRKPGGFTSLVDFVKGFIVLALVGAFYTACLIAPFAIVVMVARWVLG